jgi:hypothetical protein
MIRKQRSQSTDPSSCKSPKLCNKQVGRMNKLLRLSRGTTKPQDFFYGLPVVKTDYCFFGNIVTVQNVPGGTDNVLRGNIIGNSKQKIYICTCVLFRTISEIELVHCTVPKLLIRRYCVCINQVKKLVQFT